MRELPEVPLKMGTIYRVTNLVNGKSYIGQTIKSLDSRWYHHQHAAKHGSPQAIHKAIRKYGIQAFKIEKIVVCLEIWLNGLESVFIDQFQSHITQFGYNMTPGGSGMGSGSKHPLFGTHQSKEHSAKIGAAHKGMKRSAATRNKQKIAATGRKHSKETIEKMTGRKLSESHVASLRNAWSKRKIK